MVQKLRITHDKTRKREPCIYSASTLLMTDPTDENTGVPSAWGKMMETMMLKGSFGKDGEFITNWVYK